MTNKEIKDIPVTRIHSYNVSVAADVGINAAVIFYNICFWVEENTANERNFINGEYWTYNTVNAFKTLFPEMTYEQVRNALRKLEDNDYIKSAFLNEDTRDRTKWYTVVDKKKWITSNKCNCENSHMESEKSQMENGDGTDVNNIYNNKNTDTDNNKTDKNNNSKANSFFAKKVADRNKIINPTEIDQSELINRINKVADRIGEEVFTEEQTECVKSCMIYFAEKYARVFNKKHPILGESAINDVIANITSSIYVDHEKFTTYFGPLVSEYNDDEAYKEIIDMYFRTEFKKDIDYSIVHFSQHNVLTKLMGKATGKIWFTNE